jgi:hypothetical protein
VITHSSVRLSLSVATIAPCFRDADGDKIFVLTIGRPDTHPHSLYRIPADFVSVSANQNFIIATKKRREVQVPFFMVLMVGSPLLFKVYPIADLVSREISTTPSFSHFLETQKSA